MSANNLEEFLSRLDPKTAKRIKTAQEVETVRLPLASVGLTAALSGGIGGGRVTVVYGNTSSGKSLLMMQSVGKWQKMGLVCAWVDAEGTYDKSFGARLGIDNDQLILVQKKSFGAITDEVVPFLNAEIDVLVIDSISDIMPDVFLSDGELKGYENMKQIGAHAKGNTAMLNALHYANEKTAIVLISQTTTQIEAMYTKQVPHGGKKLEFAATQMIKLTSSNTDTKQIKKLYPVGNKLVETPVGRKVQVLVEKNKLGRQHTKAEYDLYYAGDYVGIDTDGELFDLAVQWGVISKGGAWYDWKDMHVQGRQSGIEWLKESGRVDELEKEVLLVSTGVIADDAEDEDD